MRYTLDGRTVRAGSRSPYQLLLTPSTLRPGRHTLIARLQPRTGRTRTLTTTLRVAACATRFTARQYRTTAGTGIRLRVDARTAMSAVTFSLPSAITKGLARGKPSGRIRVVTTAGRRQYALTAARGRRPAGLTGLNGRPGVRVRGRTITVTGLPAAAGIVEITVYQPQAPRGAAPAHRPPARLGDGDDPHAGRPPPEGPGQPRRRLITRRPAPSALRAVLGADPVADLRAARGADDRRRDLGGEPGERRAQAHPDGRNVDLAAVALDRANDGVGDLLGGDGARAGRSFAPESANMPASRTNPGNTALTPTPLECRS